MQESFLHYLWQYQYFDKTELTTTAGEPVQVFNPGLTNRHAGPDFSDARILIDSVLWVGTVEIHVLASDWLRHHHQYDGAYENVVLHVVWEQDKPLLRTDGSLMPTLTLKGRVDYDLVLRYRTLMQSPAPIPCSAAFSRVTSLTRFSALDIAVVSRLERKALLMMETYHRTQNDWTETVYQHMGMCFGFKVNSEPMLQLARALPYKILSKHIDNLTQVEALLFGQAGLLDENLGGPYPVLLRREYEVLSHKYQLSQRRLHRSQWRFLRLRPSNFPTLRIAQWAATLSKVKPLFSQLLDAANATELDNLLRVEQSMFWQHHYAFDSEEREDVPPLGEMSRQSVLVNLVVPLYAAYAHHRDEPEWMDKAIRLLQEIPAEVNSVTRKWTLLGEKITSAFDSQGWIELYSNYCLKKRCLDCNIGAAIIQS